jgi:hypothetical protein
MMSQCINVHSADALWKEANTEAVLSMVIVDFRKLDVGSW